MIKVNFRTNLDLLNEIWPTELPAVPNVGDLVQSAQQWPYERSFRQIELEVCRVTWKQTKRYSGAEGYTYVWEPHIELKIPSRFENLTMFFEWYGKITGRGKRAFI